jgi:hypothetical protein
MNNDIYNYDPESEKKLRNSRQFKNGARASMWDKKYSPNTNSSAFKRRDGYGLSYEEFKNASAADHLKRGAVFTFGGSGAKTTDTMNALGFLTKAQKDSVIRPGSMVGPNGPQMPKKNKMNFVTNAIVPAATLGGIGMTIADGGGLGDFLTDFAAPEIAGQAGWRLGSNLGFAGAAASGASTATKAAVGLVTGAVGFAAASVAAIGVGTLLMESADSDNSIKTLAEEKRKTDFRSSVTTSSDQMTHRRRAMEKLSKSNLNDRGQLMGNEAMIMRGMM